jgi:hypothetical protein
VLICEISEKNKLAHRLHRFSQIQVESKSFITINNLIVTEATTTELETTLKQTYQYFNDRNIDATLAMMHPEVDWPNGMEGGIEHGREAVRDYWLRQWKILDPHVQPIGFNKNEDGRIDLTVHQVVHDIQGNLLVDQIIHHIYTFEEGLIKAMEIQKLV